MINFDNLKLVCCSQFEFDEICRVNGWSSNCMPPDCAFISIIGTPDCFIYLNKTYYHWFKEENSQICNLEFDDISQDSKQWRGLNFYGMSQAQAEKTVKFIESNLGKKFFIHCLAGQSRSQGIVRYILDVYPDYYTEMDTRRDNPCFTPNIDVVAKLKRAWRNL